MESGAIERKNDNLSARNFWNKGTKKAKIKIERIHIIIFSLSLKNHVNEVEHSISIT